MRGESEVKVGESERRGFLGWKLGEMVTYPDNAVLTSFRHDGSFERWMGAELGRDEEMRRVSS